MSSSDKSHSGSGSDKFVATSGGRNNPKQIHIAHRRSASELTNLMIEQFTLQRQLEIVQAQQQQLIAQQQQLAQQSGQYPASGMSTSNQAPMGTSGGPMNSFTPQPPHPTYNNNASPSPYNQGNRSRSHSRNSSGYYNSNEFAPPAGGHRKTGSQSGVYGHNRRHSLVLNEAKKAAAEEQAKRATSGSGVSIKVDDSESLDSAGTSQSDPPEQSGFKFPASPVETAKGATPQDSKSSNVSPQKSFQFPSKPNASKENRDEFTPVGTPHRGINTKDKDVSGINANWRSQQQTSSLGGSSQQSQQQQQVPQQQQQLPQPLSQQQQFSFHKKSQSREQSSYGGLEPPAVFQPGHRSRNSNLSTHSFGSNNNGGNQSGRKSLFAPYLPQSNIPELIEEGRLVCGILRVNKKNRSDAWVATDGVLDADVYICGSKDRNRALEGDLVAVELLMVDDVWGSKKEKEEKKRRKDASSQQDIPLNSNDDYHNDASSRTVPTSNSSSSLNSTEKGDQLSPSKSSSVKRKGSLKQRPTQKKNDDVEVEGQSLLLVEEEEISDSYKPLYAGHVVAVLDRIPGQLFSGTLGLLRPSQQANSDANKPHKPKIVWFKPTDKKVPLIAIPTEQAPKDFVENTDKYSNKLFVASIKRWPITSLHPFGTLVSQLGEINEPETEIDAILRDNNFLSDEYLDPQDRSRERTTFQPNALSEDNIKARKVFDNAVAIYETKSLSDLALHIDAFNDGSFEVGCHILDVTAHIDEGSSLDRRARKRSSGVFIPQKVVHLLPLTLNDALTLKQGRSSATISVVYRFNPRYELISTWIGETIITPSSSITFQELNEQLASDSPSSFVSTIQDVATAFCRKRLNSRSINLKPDLSLLESLDDEKVKVDLNIFQASAATSIITEIERQVNSTVAQTIYQKLGDLTFLRRQSKPIATKLDSFQKKVAKLGYDIDITDSQTLLSSILSINDEGARVGVEILLFKSLGRAKYFVAGKVEPDQYEHFALNLPLYTHFTAPLRRYADHVVHRQLKSVLSGAQYKESDDSLKITSEYCNFKKDCAHHAQEQAIHLLLCKTINDMGNATGQILTMATVLQVYESAFDVLIPEFGIEKRVHGDQLPLTKAEYDGNERALELYWQAGVDSATFVPADEKNPKSYRNSIRNKFKSASNEIASVQFAKTQEGQGLLTDSLARQLTDLHIEPPSLKLPDGGEEYEPLESFLSSVVTRKENENNIQEIRELQQVPVLLRAEVGMALPCLTVRVLNPFTSRKA
ncbi:LANO_0H10572g1_1 [Lachancea nothofagi CBS 11611]|uniref:LANO_0H10572g1_1 n=1 Tax=Lachancea nothofagi CBS 11611 TaxID=1266666 RepID=A0A1G4KMC7_9SACH|nr:LANO_0H10572g1_1 [Lachancea nothofagi CBS 11611]